MSAAEGPKRLLLGADVHLEPLHREVLDRAVGKRRLDRHVELVTQVRIGLAQSEAFTLTPDRTGDLRTGEGERAVGGLEGIGEIDGVIEAEVDATVLQVEVTVGAGLVFADLGNIAEVVIDELGIDGSPPGCRSSCPGRVPSARRFPSRRSGRASF